MRDRVRHVALAAVLLCLLAIGGCLRAMGPSVTGVVEAPGPRTEPLRVVYLGTGGWILEHAGTMVLTGPLFTNPGFFTTGLLPIRSDTATVDRYMSRYDVASAVAILVGHAHYDHLMDVPRVAKRHAPTARIVGSRTVANTLGTWSGLADRVDVVDAMAGDQRTVGQWIPYGEGVRVMPLRSFHAPHFDGYTLYRGTRAEPLSEEPAWASEWLDGETYAFLIDFMAGPDSIAFRVYYQDAVAPPPAGFAPDALIEERPVDLALIVPATFDQVDWHPEALVENLNPRRVLLGHWEDFFSPVEEPARSVRLTDLRHFERRLERVFDGPWWRPDRFTELRLR
ncbi:MAG: MBL fold metallo-hydrolase [Gemmatimonadales bacterium]